MNLIAVLLAELCKMHPHISHSVAIYIVVIHHIYLFVPQVTSQRMQGLLLLIFAKYYHLPFLRGVQTETTRTGLGGYWVRWP